MRGQATKPYSKKVEPFWRSWCVDLLKKLVAKHFAEKSCEPFVLFFEVHSRRFLDRGHWITHFAGDQAMQMYVHFEGFTYNSALFGLAVSWLPVGGLISWAMLVSGSGISQNHPPRFPTRFLKPCENRGGLFFIGYDCMVGDPQKSRYLCFRCVKLGRLTYPTVSMYGFCCLHIPWKWTIHVGKYPIPGWYGYGHPMAAWFLVEIQVMLLFRYLTGMSRPRCSIC